MSWKNAQASYLSEEYAPHKSNIISTNFSLQLHMKPPSSCHHKN